MQSTTNHLTDEQERAIGCRDVSVALSAGAGCGKTFVLTERFLAALDPHDPTGQAPVDLSEVVAITFTERAAREMRDRIRGKCYRRLQAASGADTDYWLRLLRALDSARVSTIHSFCASLLRSQAVEAGLDPRFAVLEQSQSETLLLETIDDGLRRALADGDERAVGLVTDLGLDRVRSGIQALFDVRTAMDFEKWLGVTPEQQVVTWADFHRVHVLPLLAEQVARSEPAQQVSRILQTAQVTNPKMVARKTTLLELLPNLQGDNRLSESLHQILDAARVVGGGGKSAWDEERLYELYRDAAKDLRETVKKAVDYAAFDRQGALPAARMGLDLLALTAPIARAYDQEKRKVGAVDFDDLMIRARQLIAGPDRVALRRRLAARIRLLVVDEFQDTDPLQVELVKALCGEDLARGKLFFVGDSKQSIYRFRGADPQVFRQLKEAIPAAGRLPLTRNFRSQPAILDFVNALFCDAFGEDAEPLRAHRAQVGPTPAVELMWAPDGEPDAGRKGATERLRRADADWIARRLRLLLDRGEPIVGREAADASTTPDCRPAEPGDVALLFRALPNVQYYEEALRNQGIDYYLVGGHAFYAQQEIFDLLNLLRAVASPCDQVSLVGVLRSPFFSLSDETLYWLSKHRDGVCGGLFADMGLTSVDDGQRQRVAFAARTLTELRMRKDRMSVAQLIGEALSRTGYDAILLAEFMGTRKLANLRKLTHMARSADRTGLFGLSDFITQISQFVVNQPKEPLAATQPESENVVRLMTIHQAKGLEFPIVVVPDLDRGARSRRTVATFSPELGPLVQADTETACCGLDLYEWTGREEDQQELTRLFYVACTRAADRLILSSGIEDVRHPRGPWTQLLARRFDLESGDLIGDLPAGLTVPEVAVILQPPASARAAGGKQRSVDWDKSVGRAVQLASQGKGEVADAAQGLEVDRSARRQFSFSRLTGILRRPSPPAVHDDQIEDATVSVRRVDPLELGSLTHAVLEHVRFGQENDVGAIAGRLAAQHSDGPAPAADEATRLVERFLASERAAQLARADRVYRELEFLLAWPPGQAVAGGAYIDGVIDCLFQDVDGGWHVLDYKTNVVSAERLAQVASGYEMQLCVYALAAEQVLNEPPRELVLHFLRPGREYQFGWNEGARRRVVAMVDEAIAAAGEG